MSKVVQLKTIKTKILENIFIDFYITQREKGYQGEIAFFKTKLEMQEFVIKLMLEMPKDIGIIAKAYENIKQDNTLFARAKITYDLSFCNDDVKAKYMPLV